MSERDVLVVGNLRGASRSALATALKGLPVVTTELSDIEQAISSLDLKPWAAILVDTTISGASRFCGETRTKRALLDTPLIALTPRLTDLAFLNALRWGADDVVGLGAAEPLNVRLASVIAPRHASSPTPSKGRAVVADADSRRGDGLRRALHSAGYDVEGATDKASARFYASKSDIDLFVLVADLADPRSFIEDARCNGCDCRWVVLARPQHAEELERQLSSLRSVVVMSASGPPENVLFAVNLLYPSEASRRGEVRALFGTVVLFRAVGEYRDECGFSYTASPQGLYIRTLAPTPNEKVWIELIPPDGERRVRLVGKVAWSRRFGSHSAEATPPGFGVQIVDGLGEDLALWSECLGRLEFRAPATLVPEARFSVPSYKVPVPSLAPPSFTAPASVPRPESARLAGLGAGRVRISTRPPLRLSVPSPTRLSQRALAPGPATPKKPLLNAQARAALPSRRSSAGKTVMGLGLLNRDGSAAPEAKPEVPRASEATTTVSGSRRRAAQSPPEQPPSDPFAEAASSFPPARAKSPQPQAPSTPRVVSVADAAQGEPAAPEAGPNTITGTGIVPRSSSAPDANLTQHTAPVGDTAPRPAAIEALRLSPVTGRTLVYGSSAPPPPYTPRTANPTPDADARPTAISPPREDAITPDADPSEELPHDDISDRPTLADHNALSLESLPPAVLESNAPLTDEHVGRRPPPLPPTRRSSVDLRAVSGERDITAEGSAESEPNEARAHEASAGDRPVDGAVVTPTESAPHHEQEPDSVRTPTEPVFIHADDTERTAKRAVVKPRARKRSKPWAALAGTAIFAALIMLGFRLNSERAGHNADPPSTQVNAVERSVEQPSNETVGANATSGAEALAPQPGPPETTRAQPSSPKVGADAPVPAAATSGLAAAPTAPTSAATPEAVPEPSVDPQLLPSKSGLLYVRSPHDTRVFLHGVESGPTNTWLTVPCGTRFLRLGSAPGKWLSPGFATAIRCRAANPVDVVDE